MYLHLYLFISFCNKHNICYMCWCYVQRGRFKKELVNLRALKILTWYKNHIFQCLGALWNSIQNILSILWKVRNLLRSDLSAFLRARKRFWSPPPPPPPRLPSLFCPSINNATRKQTYIRDSWYLPLFVYLWKYYLKRIILPPRRCPRSQKPCA